MRRPTEHNPYCGFTDDKERRRALNTRARSYAVVAIASALGSSHILTEVLSWLMHLRWFH
jgi:hypothetical protein